MAQANSAPGAGCRWLGTIVRVLSIVLAALSAIVALAGYLWVKRPSLRPHARKSMRST